MGLATKGLYFGSILLAASTTGSTAGCVETSTGPKCTGAGQVCLASCCPGYTCQLTPGTDPPTGTCVPTSVLTSPVHVTPNIDHGKRPQDGAAPL